LHSAWNGASWGNVVYESNHRRPPVRAVQLALRRHGYNPAIVSGEYVAETRLAVRRYQRDHGLRESGLIDHSLLLSLGLS
jgi:peptidoglycan hydrolase-like protein with peptidoglycan-binding domain